MEIKKSNFRVPNNWVDTYLKVRYPELVEPFLQCARICEHALWKEKLDQNDLDVLIENAKKPQAVLSGNVAEMIGKLANFFELADQTYKQLYADRKAHIRLNAFDAFGNPNRDLEQYKELLIKAFNDRSSKIRETVMFQALEFGLKDEVKKAVENEKNQEAKEWLHERVRKKEDGFLIEFDEKGTITLDIQWVSFFQLDDLEELEKWLSRHEPELKEAIMQRVEQHLAEQNKKQK